MEYKVQKEKKKIFQNVQGKDTQNISCYRQQIVLLLHNYSYQFNACIIFKENEEEKNIYMKTKKLLLFLFIYLRRKFEILFLKLNKLVLSSQIGFFYALEILH